jgi:hypothetical protein
LIEHFADRAMLIERGNVLATGDPHEIGLQYNQVNFGELVHDLPAYDGEGAHRAVEIAGCWIEVGGERVTDLPHGEQLEILTELRFHKAIEDPVFALTLRNDAGHTVFATSTQWMDSATGHFEAGEVATMRVGVAAWFAASRYRATPSVARAGSGADTIDLREDAASFILHSTRSTGGVLDVPHTLEIDRAGVSTQ